MHHCQNCGAITEQLHADFAGTRWEAPCDAEYACSNCGCDLAGERIDCPSCADGFLVREGEVWECFGCGTNHTEHVMGEYEQGEVA